MQVQVQAHASGALISISRSFSPFQSEFSSSTYVHESHCLHIARGHLPRPRLGAARPPCCYKLAGTAVEVVAANVVEDSTGMMLVAAAMLRGTGLW